MKQGAVINRIVMILLSLAILIYLGGAAWKSFHIPYPTFQAYPETVDTSTEVTGFLVREETVLGGSGGIVDLIPNEGEKVGVGGVLAVMYTDQASVERMARLEALEREAEQMRQAISTAGAPGEVSSGQNVVASMVRLRSNVESGDLTQLERSTQNYKSAVLQQALRQGTTDQLTTQLDQVQAEIETLRLQTGMDVGRVMAQESGIFSGRVDGYETVLNAEFLEHLTPSELERVEHLEMPEEPSGLCKLITNSNWYFICTLPENQSVRLHEGDRVTVRFSRDWSGEVEMEVDRISAPENGKVAVTFRSNRYLSEITLLRRQTVELIFSTSEGLRVPINAVRMDENNVTGVYVMVGVKAEFKPVEVLEQGEDYYLVRPVLSEKPDVKEKKKTLRAGDLVIVAREEIWDGKIVR